MKSLHNNWKRFGLGAALLGGALVTVVYAADPRFDLAIDNIVKAKALITAAEQPAVNPANQAQLTLLRRQILHELQSAYDLIEQAKTVADAP